MVITVILSFLEETKAISCQILNKHMYHQKIPIMTNVVVGRRIEPDIIIYSEYKDRLGAVSVIIGRVPSLLVGFGSVYKKECR